MVESKFRQTTEDRVIQLVPPRARGLTWPSSRPGSYTKIE